MTISTDNMPLSTASSDGDFTVGHYRHLLNLAKQNYIIASYTDIPWGEKFVLWRHDIDFSLNRSLLLAQLEHDVGVRATYFLNPHSDFYNLAELRQHKIVQEILKLGHGIGLHFDAAFHFNPDEPSLHAQVSAEATALEKQFGVRPEAFSFHNPVVAHLSLDGECYGGLLNCYSKRFRTEVAYCSDSNGYWRFRRLHDVLASANDRCLQVLTHPGWWQNRPMPPRQRVFRCAYGRAQALMRQYDVLLSDHGRLNLAGLMTELQPLRLTHPERFELLDYLGNQDHLDSLFIELWRLYQPYFKESEFHSETHQQWSGVFERLARGDNSVTCEELQAGCRYLACVIQLQAGSVKK